MQAHAHECIKIGVKGVIVEKLQCLGPPGYCVDAHSHRSVAVVLRTIGTCPTTLLMDLCLEHDIFWFIALSEDHTPLLI